MADKQAGGLDVGDRLGRYEILKRLGNGGMAEVYLAKVVGPLAISQVVVLKRILPELKGQPHYVQMFMDEARIVAGLTHPNIVQMFDVPKDDDGNYFLVLEHCAGHDVQHLLVSMVRKKERVPLEVALHIISSVAAGLHHAHEATDEMGKSLRIVHRDISPQNVIVSHEGNVKLLDFGVAKATNKQNHTAVGVIKGKPSYMSPEQCLGKPVDRRSDIFSLGIMMWELITAKKLFFANAQFELFMKITKGPIPSIKSVWPECPPELDRIVQKALSQDVTKRYQTARELQLDIERFAREQRLALSPASTNDFMQRMFAETSGQRRQIIADSLFGTESNPELDTIETAAPVMEVTFAPANPEAAFAGGTIELQLEMAKPIEPESQKTASTRARPSRLPKLAVAFGALSLLVVSGLFFQRFYGIAEVHANSAASDDVVPPHNGTEIIPLSKHRSLSVVTRHMAEQHQGQGRVQFTSEIPVDITVDGVARGATPVTLMLSTGVHEVAVKNGQYSIHHVTKVNVLADHTITKHLVFNTIDQ